MNRQWGGWLVVLSLMIVAAGCAPAATQAMPTDQPAEPGALLNVKGALFSTSGQCSACHTGLKTAGGMDISIDTDWRSTMMANAARDPYYRASVRRETLANPQYKEFIQDKCSTCHVPMAHFTTAAGGGKTAMLDDGVFASTHPDHALAMDGVSCTLCHQIQPEGLGTADSFSGGLAFDETAATGDRALFGQFAVAENWVTVMQAASGFVPAQASHTAQSALCATCHNLFTPYITNDGKISAELFPEQTPYTEWENSDFVDKQSCQDCHMPDAGEAVAISTVNPEKRSPFRQHTFIGGNQFMLSLLQANGDALEVTALDEQFEQTLQLTEQQLSAKTATIHLTPELEGQVLNLGVSIENLTGHKFPTSFPSRRVWLHVLMTDQNGAVVFESGAWDPNGAIPGNINDQDSFQFEPHYERITQPDQVQIYETIIGDPNGAATTTLLRAQRYLKDNRLLAAGMDKTALPAEIAVVGEAGQDVDFAAGGDSLVYQIQLSGQGAYQVTVELLYQSIGYRWAENLRGEPFTDEARSFLEMLNATPLTPARVTQASAEINLP